MLQMKFVRLQVSVINTGYEVLLSATTVFLELLTWPSIDDRLSF